MGPFSVIVFGVEVWTIAVSGAKKAPFSFENRLVWMEPLESDFEWLRFGVVVWTIAVSGAKQLRFRLKTD